MVIWKKSYDYDEKLGRQNQSLWKRYSDLPDKNEHRKQNKSYSEQNTSVDKSQNHSFNTKKVNSETKMNKDLISF